MTPLTDEQIRDIVRQATGCSPTAIVDPVFLTVARAGLREAARICDSAGAAAFGRHEAFEDGCDACRDAIRRAAGDA